MLMDSEKNVILFRVFHVVDLMVKYGISNTIVLEIP